jgi:hypothetical protein
MQAIAQLIKRAVAQAARGPAMAGIYVKSVAIAAAHDWTHDPIMLITWSMPDAGAVIDVPEVALPGVRASVISRPADTAIRLDRNLASPAELEDAILAAAWEMGSWDLVRLELAPLAAGADWWDARHGIAPSFGRNPYTICGQPLVVGEGADDEVCEAAAVGGYIKWRFLPTTSAGANTRQHRRGKDATLQPNGARPGSPGEHRAAWRHPVKPLTACEHQYQLGQSAESAGAGQSRGGRPSYERRLARREAIRAQSLKNP